MIHLLYGKDNYRVHEALMAVRNELAPDDDARRDLASNTTVLDGAKLTPQELIAQATTVPFLAPHRLVIVEGLLAALAGIKSGRKGAKGKKKAADEDDPLAPWRDVAEQLGDAAVVPPRPSSSSSRATSRRRMLRSPSSRPSRDRSTTRRSRRTSSAPGS